MNLVYSVIIGLLGAFDPLMFKQGKDEYRLRSFGLRAAIFAALAYYFLWLTQPTLTGLGLGVGNWLVVLAFTFVSRIWISCQIEGDYHYDKAPFILRWSPTALTLLILILGWASGGGYYWKGVTKSHFIGKVEQQQWNSSLAPIDVSRPRLVSLPQAEWIGKGALKNGEGSQFSIGAYTIQRVGDELWFVAPLEYHNYLAQRNSQATPGAVVVHGHDPKENPFLQETNRTGKPLQIRFTPEAWFGRNLVRHIYNAGYGEYNLDLADFHLEFDDSLNPFWIVPLIKPTLGFGGKKLEGILIVNPTTGAIEPKSLNDVPDWIDRVYPKSIALSYIKFWGELHNGGYDAWANAATGLTSPDGHVQMVFGPNGRCYYYVGLTSNSTKDHTMLSYVLMDTRTGATTQYMLDSDLGAARTVDSILANVGSQVNFNKWLATDAIPYNIYGVLGYVCPVVNSAHAFEAVAISDLSGQKIVVEPNLTKALQSFRGLLAKETTGNRASPTQNSVQVAVDGEVFRVNSDTTSGNQTYYIILKNSSNRTFFGKSDVSTDLPLTRDGDLVRIIVTETGEKLVPIMRFENLKLQR